MSEHNARQLMRALDEMDDLRDEVLALSAIIVDGYAELTETHGSPEANIEAAVLVMRETAFRLSDD